MKDQDDKQKLEIDLEQPKRGRGRPATGAALTPAQKQKAYRERLKSNVTEKESKAEEVEKLREMARAEFKRAEGLQAQVIDMGLKIAQLENKVTELEIAQLEHEVRQEKSNVTEKEYEQMLKMLDEANKEKKYWIDRALKKGAESTKPRFELQHKSHNGRWVKGAYQEEMHDQLMTKEAAEELRARMQKATDDDPKGTLTWRIKELK
ncbi:hypothetical protein [Pseudomonas sp. WS 5011]|uniref:hypothetical protein n=1 Tax=Pseudomonas sp. WS 5011 TaxID=2717477 RepID=UPI001473DF8D|nr:hypothetical protein [Pseudomonas sp. WS 5011]NMY53524.1 hypothetical protein [Pseudomonas sp. WS 5011]